MKARQYMCNVESIFLDILVWKEGCREPSLEYLFQMGMKSHELGFSALEHWHVAASLVP